MDPFNFSILVNGHEAPSKTSTSNADDISETNPSQIGLLQKRPSDFSNPDIKYPSFYESLSEKSKDEFKNLWNLAQSIQSNANAHKSQFDNSKRFITTGPLQLNSFISEVKGKRIAFSLENFLKESNISLKVALLVNAELNGAQLNAAKLNNAELNDAELNGAQLHDAQLYGAKLYGAKLNYADLNNIQISFDTQFNKDTELKNIRLDSLSYTDEAGKVTQYTNQEQIRDLFVRLGANSNNISFASAA